MEGDSLKVALFGGTGFVGSYIVDELVSREHHPRLMVRSGSEASRRHADVGAVGGAP